MKNYFVTRHFFSDDLRGIEIFLINLKFRRLSVEFFFPNSSLYLTIKKNELKTEINDYSPITKARNLRSDLGVEGEMKREIYMTRKGSSLR